MLGLFGISLSESEESYTPRLSCENLPRKIASAHAFESEQTIDVWDIALQLPVSSFGHK